MFFALHAPTLENVRKTGAYQGAVERPIRTILVHPWLASEAGAGLRSKEAALEEGEGLVRAFERAPVASFFARLSEIRRGSFFTTGKMDEIAAQVQAHEADLVVVNHTLAPVQQRTLEAGFGAKVLDRTGLILELFARRARTREAWLQVELAQLAWQKNRLVRFWTHLERQRGGRGFLAGPGERQIESDRRQIAKRITMLKKRLEAVRKRRALHRKARRRAAWPALALVGYSNAGKSTLFNRLTGAGQAARKALFSTLDPAMRACTLPGGGKFVLSDTVGFISDLPPELIASFRATLEEVEEADLILHIRDISHPDTAAQKNDVENVLETMGMDPRDKQRVVEVFNKIDRLAPPARTGIASRPSMFAVSAETGEGIPALLEAVQNLLLTSGGVKPVHILLKPEQRGRAMAFLRRHGRILEEKLARDGSASLDILLPAGALGHFRKHFLTSEGEGAETILAG